MKNEFLLFSTPKFLYSLRSLHPSTRWVDKMLNDDHLHFSEVSIPPKLLYVLPFAFPSFAEDLRLRALFVGTQGRHTVSCHAYSANLTFRKCARFFLLFYFNSSRLNWIFFPAFSLWIELPKFPFYFSRINRTRGTTIYM